MTLIFTAPPSSLPDYHCSRIFIRHPSRELCRRNRSLISEMSELLLKMAETARRSRNEQGEILTADFLETCRGLLPILGEVHLYTIQAALLMDLTIQWHAMCTQFWCQEAAPAMLRGTKRFLDLIFARLPVAVASLPPNRLTITFSPPDPALSVQKLSDSF